MLYPISPLLMSMFDKDSKQNPLLPRKWQVHRAGRTLQVVPGPHHTHYYLVRYHAGLQEGTQQGLTLPGRVS